MRTPRRKSTSQKIKGEKGFTEVNQKNEKRKKENGHIYIHTFLTHIHNLSHPFTSLLLL